MRANGFTKVLMIMTGLATSAAVIWAGLALWSPAAAGVKALPPLIARLPFERRWWAVAVMTLGAAGALSALPPPHRRAPKSPALRSKS